MFQIRDSINRQRNPRLGRGVLAVLVLFGLYAGVATAQMRPPQDVIPQNELPEPLRNIGIDQKLDGQIPLDLVFRDETGRDVALAEYFKDRPVIVALVYYTCPMLCNQVLTGLVGSLKSLAFEAGKEYDVVCVSFDPRESSDEAQSKKTEYTARYGRSGAETGWHFLTGEEASIRALTDAVGFRYGFDERTDQYVHASGIMVATPEGRLSHYFYGIEYSPKDLRFSLIEASQNRIGNLVDQVLLYCFHYDPTTGKYGPVIMNIIRLGGLVTFFGVALLIIIKRRSLKARARRAGETDESTIGFNPTQLALIPFAPEQASSVAGSIDNLYGFLVAITIFFSVSITLVIIYFAVRYRRRSESEIPRPIEGSMKLEATWIIIPFLIAMISFVWGTSVYFKVFREPDEAMDIYVVGKQWMWKFQHPDGQREINELHVPIGRRVKLTMTTEDVIHSLFVPAFRIKYDVVPGRYTTVWFQPTKAGRYDLFCTEYCGTQHSGMIGSVVVMEPSDYQAWLSGGRAEGTLASSGERLFTDLACITCHRPDSRGRGPSLAGVFGKDVVLDSGQTVSVDEAYLRESILNPRAKIVAGYQPIMPTFQGLINEEQLLQLMEYIKSLSTPQGQTAPATGAAPTQPAESAR